MLFKSTAAVAASCPTVVIIKKNGEVVVVSAG